MTEQHTTSLDQNIQQLEADIEADIAAAPSQTAIAAPAAEAQAADRAKTEYQGLFEQLLTPGFDVLAPAWEVSAKEITALSEAYAAVAAKYYPDPDALGPEVGAVLLTAMVILPRAKLPRKRPKRAPAPAPATPPPGEPDPQPEPGVQQGRG